LLLFFKKEDLVAQCNGTAHAAKVAGGLKTQVAAADSPLPDLPLIRKSYSGFQKDGATGLVPSRDDFVQRTLIMKHRLALFCAVSAILPGAVQAQTLSVTQLAAIRESVSAPPTSFFGPQGQTLFLQAAVTDVNGNYSNAGVFALPAYTSGPASGGNYSIPMAPSPAFNGVYYWQAYAPTGYSNAWTLQFGDKGGLGAPVQTPAEVTGPPLPFASNITMSGDPSHPTFTWTHAQASRLNGSAFCIYSGELEVFCAFPGNGDVTYTLPPASANGYNLVPGNTYYFNIAAYSLRPGQATLCGNPCVAASSNNYIVYVPPSDTLPLVHIPEPTSSNPNATTLRFRVLEDERYDTYVAPISAVGYAYQALSGPNFAAVTLPAGQSSNFTVSYNVNGTTTTRKVPPGRRFPFPAGGVSTFVVTGATPSGASGFITGLQFTGSGTFVGVQSALSPSFPQAGASVAAAASVASKPD
jgi:hypothetical protein